MPDREKVINAINCCLNDSLCSECDYEGIPRCFDRVLLTDVLALLKEQEDIAEAFNEAVARCRKYMEKCGAIPTYKGKQLFFADGKGNITPLPDIVRCKDCFFRDVKNRPVLCQVMADDWFCADGRRKDE